MAVLGMREGVWGQIILRYKKILDNVFFVSRLGPTTTVCLTYELRVVWEIVLRWPTQTDTPGSMPAASKV